MSKKTFKDEFNPALQFISTSSERTGESQARNTLDAVPMKRNPLYIETKSKRVQLLMQPSLYSKLKQMAEQKKSSVNDVVHTILEKYTRKIK